MSQCLDADFTIKFLKNNISEPLLVKRDNGLIEACTWEHDNDLRIGYFITTARMEVEEYGRIDERKYVFLVKKLFEHLHPEARQVNFIVDTPPQTETDLALGEEDELDIYNSITITYDKSNMSPTWRFKEKRLF
jgi:hypothetical protein